MKNDNTKQSLFKTQKQLGWIFLLSGVLLVVLAFVMAKGEMPDWMGKSMTGLMFVIMGALQLIIATVRSKRLTKENQ